MGYERGERLPDIEYLARFSAVTGADLEELLNLRLHAAGVSGIRVSLSQWDSDAPVGPHPYPGLEEAPAAYSADDLDDDFVLIPRLSVEASAGPGALAERENILDHMAFRADWLRSTLGTDPRNLVLITAVGDSMEPAIRAGDLLLIDTSIDRITNDAIYVLVRGGETVVKRVQTFFGGAVTVRSDNPAYVDETLDPSAVNDMRVAGRVRWIARMI